MQVEKKKPKKGDPEKKKKRLIRQKGLASHVRVSRVSPEV